MNKNKAEVIREDVDKMLEEIGKKHNINLKVVSGTYSDIDYNFKVTGGENVVKVGGEEMSGAEANFKKNATWYGMEPEWFGRMFTMQGNKYEIVGLAPRNTKYNILAKSFKDGKTYKVNSIMINDLLRIR